MDELRTILLARPGDEDRRRNLPSRIAAIAITVLIGACNAQERVPAAPTQNTTPTSTPSAPSGSPRPSFVFVENARAFRESLSTETDAYHVTFQLHETGGATAATIKAIELAFENGLAATFGPEFAEMSRVRPGATVSVSGLRVTGTRASRAGSVQIRVLITDDNGADSIAAAASPVTATFRLSGRITDAATNRPVAGAVVTVTFGAASGRSATSDATGNYLLNQIPAGSVAFTIAAPGYSTVTRSSNIDGDAMVDVSLSRAQ
jgi:hypothetical protein